MKLTTQEAKETCDELASQIDTLEGMQGQVPEGLPMDEFVKGIDKLYNCKKAIQELYAIVE